MLRTMIQLSAYHQYFKFDDTRNRLNKINRSFGAHILSKPLSHRRRVSRERALIGRIVLRSGQKSPPEPSRNHLWWWWTRTARRVAYDSQETVISTKVKTGIWSTCRARDRNGLQHPFRIINYQSGTSIDLTKNRQYACTMFSCMFPSSREWEIYCDDSCRPWSSTRFLNHFRTNGRKFQISLRFPPTGNSLLFHARKYLAARVLRKLMDINLGKPKTPSSRYCRAAILLNVPSCDSSSTHPPPIYHCPRSSFSSMSSIAQIFCNIDLNLRRNTRAWKLMFYLWNSATVSSFITQLNCDSVSAWRTVLGKLKFDVEHRGAYIFIFGIKGLRFGNVKS